MTVFMNLEQWSGKVTISPEPEIIQSGSEIHSWSHLPGISLKTSDLHTFKENSFCGLKTMKYYTYSHQWDYCLEPPIMGWGCTFESHGNEIGIYSKILIVQMFGNPNVSASCEVCRAPFSSPGFPCSPLAHGSTSSTLPTHLDPIPTFSLN